MLAKFLFSASMLVGLAGLWALDYYDFKDHSILFPAFQNAAALIASVGTIGLIVELIMRKRLLGEITNRLKILFESEPEFAQKLSLAERQKMVKNVLVAHLGQEKGDAVYKGAVSRYISDRDIYFRKKLVYRLFLTELQNDVDISVGGTQITFKKADYFRIKITFEFRRVFVPDQSSLVFVLHEHDTQIDNWYKNPGCLFRDIIHLNPCHIAKLTTLLAPKSGSPHPLPDEFLKVNLSIGDEPVSCNAEAFVVASKTLSFSFSFDSLRATDSEIDHKIEVSSLISKAAEAYPIHLVDPSLDPQFIFCYPHTLRGGCIEHYLHSQRPFDPQIEQHEGYIEMNVRSTDNDGSPVWVFPDSGVVYTWNQ